MDFFEQMEARIPHGEVRTRFAPSPTGYMHVGNLRTALYTWLIARRRHGKFILRIEDTDQGRLVEGAVDVIYKTMAECGLDHDEGPDIGGPVGPYIQSERRELFGKYAKLLCEKGGAYYCFCQKSDEDESEAAPGEIKKHVCACRDLPLAEAKKRVEAGEPFVIRQRIPHEGTTTFHDASFGDITVENKELEDQVLLKSDGLPTYNFANVVDDHLMGITHVVRGSEYLSSAPKYNLLYEAFGWEIPTYVHCSPVMRDAQHKMSKRHGDPSYEDLIREGYLTEAVLNYVALLGWSPKGENAEREFYTLAELAEIFDISGISKSPAVFDINKLRWMNAEYMKKLSPEAFFAKAEPVLKTAVTNPAVDLRAVAALVQPRVRDPVRPARARRLHRQASGILHGAVCPQEIQDDARKQPFLPAGHPAGPGGSADLDEREPVRGARRPRGKAGGQELRRPLAAARGRLRQGLHPRRRHRALRPARQGRIPRPHPHRHRAFEQVTTTNHAPACIAGRGAFFALLTPRWRRSWTGRGRRGPGRRSPSRTCSASRNP